MPITWTKINFIHSTFDIQHSTFNRRNKRKEKNFSLSLNGRKRRIHLHFGHFNVFDEFRDEFKKWRFSLDKHWSTFDITWKTIQIKPFSSIHLLLQWSNIKFFSPINSTFSTDIHRYQIELNKFFFRSFHQKREERTENERESEKCSMNKRSRKEIS